MASRTPASLLRRLSVWLALALVIAVGAAFAVTRWAPDEQAYPVQGVDVSERNGALDWKRLRAAGAEFAYVRATFGATGRDGAFVTHWEDTLAAGVRRGALHEFNLCQLAADQAANLITTVPRQDRVLPVAVQLGFSEDCAAHPDRAVLIGEIENFIRQVEAHTEQPVVLSLDQAFEDEYRVTEAIDRPFWARRAFFPPDFGAHGWIMWQANPWRRADGANGNINWSVVRK